MAYTDSLFQLGMDLTRSSTAQKEDHGQAAQVAREERKVDASTRSGRQCAGTHLIIDLFGAQRLDDLAHIKATLERCVELARGKLLQIHSHRLTPYGSLCAVAVLAEGHISIHSWPKARNAALDVFMGADTNPHAAIAAVTEAFRPTKAVVKEHLRADAKTRRGGRAQSKRAHLREKAQQAA